MDIQFWVHPEYGFYTGDQIDGARAATQAEIYAHLNPQLTLAELKAAKWSEIKTKRDTLEQSGLPYMGKTLDSDTLSVQRISIAVQAAQAAIAAGQALRIGWTCADNSVLTMTAQEIVGIPVALAQHLDSLHQIARGLRKQIEEAETQEDLDRIVWPE